MLLYLLIIFSLVETILSVPDGWTCAESKYGDGTCDCGCGEWDIDCDDRDNNVEGCDPGDDQVALGCSPVDGSCVFVDWTCSTMNFNSGDGCHCGCGYPDPDCYIEDADIEGCGGGNGDACNVFVGQCQDMRQMGYYNARDGCDCAEGDAPDPDCYTSFGTMYMYEGDSTSYTYTSDLSPDRVCKVQGDGKTAIVSYGEYKCDYWTYGRRDGCHCDCGLIDPDCWDRTQKVICGLGQQDGLDYHEALKFECIENFPEGNTSCIRIGWTCETERFNDGVCDCGCGTWDVDCNIDNQINETHYCEQLDEGSRAVNCINLEDKSILGCEGDEYCNGDGFCVPYCDASLFNRSDGTCECACSSVWEGDLNGLMDPDCLMENAKFVDCPVGYACRSDNDWDDPLCVPEIWTCLPSRHVDDVCDCECGDWDATGCTDYYGVARGCDNELRPYCSETDLMCHSGGDWNINADDGCHCETSSWDEDCVDDKGGNQTTYGCEEGDSCFYPGECRSDSNWICWAGSWGSGDGCDCNCGKWDPDCEEEGSIYFPNARNCVENETCQYISGFSRCVPNDWLCPASTFGAKDGCHCNCGTHDTDCDFSTQAVIGCLPGEYCDQGECRVIYPSPDEWTCEEDLYYSGEACDCECGAYDPDCNNITLKHLQVNNCEPEQYCGSTGTCMDHGEDPIPHGWFCPDDWYIEGEICHCECGGYDPACDIPGAEIVGCLPDIQSCQKVTLEDETELGECMWDLPIEWTCDVGEFSSGEGCNCSCGIYDPDCDNPDAVLYGCNYEYEMCAQDGTCACQEEYFGDECQYTTCGGFDSNDDLRVCTGYGTCWPYETCVCDSSDYMGKLCNITTCRGIFSNDSSVCESHGECFPYEVCTCLSHWDHFGGGYCNITSCGGILSTDVENVCNQHGECVKYDSCHCFDGVEGDKYYGNLCDVTTCYGHYSNESTVCSGHGSCWPEDVCNCDEGYNGTTCEIWTCYGLDHNLTLPEDICGGRGQCIGRDECDCHFGYHHNSEWYEGVLGWELGEFGEYSEVLPCSIYQCYEYWNLDVDICGGNGTCLSPDNCTCENGFYHSDCTEFMCFWVNVTETPWIEPCSGHGECISGDRCVCEFGYIGVDCSLFTCFMTEDGKVEQPECGGNGECIALDICECSNGWEGEKCDEKIFDAWGYVGVPVTATFATGIGLAFFTCLACCSCLCIVAVFAVIVYYMYGKEVVNVVEEFGRRRKEENSDSDDDDEDSDHKRKRKKEKVGESEEDVEDFILDSDDDDLDDDDVI